MLSWGVQLSPDKAAAGITGGNSALGLFSTCFFSPLGFNPLIPMLVKLLFLLQGGVCLRAGSALIAGSLKGRGIVVWDVVGLGSAASLHSILTFLLPPKRALLR